MKSSERIRQVIEEIRGDASDAVLIDRLCAVQGFLRHGVHDVKPPALPAEPPPGYVRVTVPIVFDHDGRPVVCVGTDWGNLYSLHKGGWKVAANLIADVQLPTVPTITATVVPGEGK